MQSADREKMTSELKKVHIQILIWSFEDRHGAIIREKLMEFGKATGKARQLISKRVLNDSEVAELEAYFQQATVGDGNNWKLLRSKTFFLEGNKKRFSWLNMRGMPRSEAMEKYIDLVDEFSTKYCVVFPPSSPRFGSVNSVATATTYLPPFANSSSSTSSTSSSATSPSANNTNSQNNQNSNNISRRNAIIISPEREESSSRSRQSSRELSRDEK